MQNCLRAVVVLLLLLFTYVGNSQSFFSKRLTVANKVNLATSFEFYADTFFIPVAVIETFGPNTYSSCLLKVTKTGNIVTQKRFKPVNVNYTGGNDLYIKNNKFYVASLTDYGLQLRAGFYVFNQNCDTVFTKSYGDTTYYNYGNKIQPYKKTKDKLLIFGMTDSTCGTNHPGLYKPIIRVVDTNGILSQTNLYMGTCKYRTLLSCDTTVDKGYIFSGSEFNGPGSNNNYILKLDSNLNMQWVKNIDTSEFFCGIVSSKRGGYYFAVDHVDSNYLNSFYWERISLTRLDGNGNVKWKKFYGTKAQGNAVTNVKELSNGDIIICGVRGVIYGPTVGQQVGYLLRTDSLGNLKWWNNYIPTSPIKDTAGDCYLYDVMEMPDKGFAAVGWVGGNSGLGTIQESWLLRVDSMGCLVPGCTIGTGVDELGMKNEEIIISPNPNSGLIAIEILNTQFTLEESEIKIINVLGQENLKEKLRSKKQEIDLRELSAGIYYLQLIKQNKIVLTKKIIKQ